MKKEQSGLRGLLDRIHSFTGRRTVHVYDRVTDSMLLRAEYALTPWLGVKLTACSIEGELCLHVALPPLSLWLTVPAPDRLLSALGASRDSPGEYGREYGVTLREGVLRWQFADRTNEWRASDPRWMRWSLDLVEAVLGPVAEVDSSPLRVERVDVPMPEGTYAWRFVLRDATWSRRRWPRWPLAERARVFDAECEDGQQIPVPGKGTTSYNCGPDATFAMSGRADDLADAVAQVVASTLASRRSRGGSFTYVEGGVHDPKRAGSDGHVPGWRAPIFVE